MGIFKKTEYVDEVIPEISGNEGAMIVTIKNMPCRRETITSKRKFPYTDFPPELLDELFGKHLVEYENVRQLLQRGDKFVVAFRLRQLPEMSLEIRGTIPDKKDIFKSDLADALINGWEQYNIKR